jgi:D-alanyl-D-alanine carboxypeptidase
MTTVHPHITPIRNKLTAAAAACALLGAAGTLSACGTNAAPSHASPATLRAALRGDLSRFLHSRRAADHLSAVSLRVALPGSRPAIALAAGTTRYGGGPPVTTGELWQIGSTTKAFTSVILLQLEAEGKLSISDPIGKWLPQYRAWRQITIRQLLDMTSRIPDYASQPAFLRAFAADQQTRFTAARLVSYVAGLPLGPAGYHYTNTDYILAQMIIEKVTGDSYASQLTKRITGPLRLRTTCLAPYTCPASDATRMATAYFDMAGSPPSTLGKAVPPLSLTYAQGAGGIVSSLADLTTWERALYSGQLLPAPQQHQLESLVSEATGRPIRRTTTAGAIGYGLGVQQQNVPQVGPIWVYQGQSFGNRVLYLYFPRSGMTFTLAVNSAVNVTTDNDLARLADSVYLTLHQAGAAPTS